MAMFDAARDYSTRPTPQSQETYFLLLDANTGYATHCMFRGKVTMDSNFAKRQFLACLLARLLVSLSHLWLARSVSAQLLRAQHRQTIAQSR
jgi:hypothetical protein